MVYNVRPPLGLTWVRSDGRVPENATQQMQEKDGLFNISSKIQVTKADFDKQYTCEANGDAVNGTSSMKITIIEGDVATDSHDRGINKSLITSIVINFILLILFVSCLIYYKKYGSPGPLGVVKLQKPEQLGDIESQPLTDQEELTATKLSQKIELLENERKEDRASFEEEKRVIESNWQKTVNDQFEKLKTQELTVTKLSKKIESLESERKEDRASFKEEKRVIESNSQKTVNDQFEKLKTQELAVTKLSQKIERKDRASFEEEKREIESKWKKIVNDQVQMLKTQELTVTKLSQKIEVLENERKEDRASFEEEKREIESKWQNTHSIVEKLKTQAKVGVRNNILKKLANTKWGTDAKTIRTTALALYHSTAEYAAPAWCTSSHAAKIDPAMNATYRAITGCLRPTRVDDLYLLCGIAPPHIRSEVSAQEEKIKQEDNPFHPPSEPAKRNSSQNVASFTRLNPRWLCSQSKGQHYGPTTSRL
ncbi:uncharacterized protein LOC121419664 [Lytechinus variegatus]|uniref:uncharacterized protein LOC121419664 n=1 Tax=Lytechinus variegatus TaxID=7654 RepID=UPI001BB1B6C2|nr:uncharacterized protein LOC121419664 [Lytechinus variegatus]